MRSFPSAHSLPARAESHEQYGWKRDWYLWLPLACLSWWLAYRFRDVFISDWDGFDYTGYAVQGLPSALGLSRALFLGYNHLLWKLAQWWLGTPPEMAYLILRYGAIVQSGPAVAGIYALNKELTASRTAAFWSALIVVASPYYIIYSGRAMSEIPGFLLLGWAWWWLVRSLRRGELWGYLLGAALVGLSANIREFALFYFPAVVLVGRCYRMRWRWCLTALVMAVTVSLAGMAFWLYYDTDNYWRAVSEWYAMSAEERRVHPVTLKNFQFLADYAFNCSAAAALLGPLGLAMLWTRRKLRGLWRLGVCGLLANLVLLVNHDLSVNPRYLLTGLFGLALVSGWSLAELGRNRLVHFVPLVLSLCVATKATYNHTARQLYEQQWTAREARDYIAKIKHLPWNAAFIVGSRTPLVNFYVAIEARPYWRAIAPGAPWPDEKLGERIDELLLAGRKVYVDFDLELWQAGARGKSREETGLETIKRDYLVELVRDSFYRIVQRRPVTRLLE